MTSHDPVKVDQCRGMAAQQATALRRLLAGVKADRKVLGLRQHDPELHLLARPAADWPEAAEKPATC